MNAREALINDILAWAPPSKEKMEDVRGRLVQKTDHELKARHSRLKRLEKWASAELADISPHTLAKRRRQIIEDDNFAADLLSALNQGDDLGSVVDRYRKPLPAPALVTGGSRRLAADDEVAAHITKIASVRPRGLAREFSAWCLSIVQDAFPRAFDTGTPSLEMSLILQKDRGPVHLKAIDVVCTIDRIVLKCSFDLNARRVNFDVPDVALITPDKRIAAVYEMKKRAVEEGLTPFLKNIDSLEMMRDYLFSESSLIGKETLDKALSEVVAARLSLPAHTLLGIDNPGSSIAEFAARYESSFHSPSLLLPQDLALPELRASRLQRTGVMVFTACYLDHRMAVQSHLRRAAEVFPGVSLKVAAIGITDDVRRALGYDLIGAPIEIGPTDLAPWDPDGRYHKTKAEHIFGHRSGQSHTAHHVPIKEMARLVENARKK